MTEKDPKEVLKANAFFLKTNIVPTEEFWKQLARDHVLPESMLREAQAFETVQEQNAKLLELLAVRGKASTLKFCDVLQLTNHNYLAQFLREELSSDAQQQSVGHDAETLLQRYPRLEKQLDKHDRTELAKIIQEKAKELLLKKDWMGDNTDKNRALEAKAKQLEDHFQLSDMLKEKDSMIKQMSETLDKAVRDAESKGVSLKYISSYLNEMKKKHQNDLRIQMQYNAANDNSIRREQDRIAGMEQAFHDMNNDIQRHLKADAKISRMSSTSSMEGFKMITTMDNCKSSLAKLLTRFEKLMDIESAHEKLSADAFYVLTHTGRDVKSNLRDAFQAFVVENEENLTALRDEILVLRSQLEKGKLSSRDANLQENHMIKDLELVLQKVRAESRAKDDKIKGLRNESEKLRQEVMKLEKQLAKLKTGHVRIHSPKMLNQKGVKSPTSNKSDSESNNFRNLHQLHSPFHPHPHPHHRHTSPEGHPQKTHHIVPEAHPTKYTLPAIKGASSTQGTIKFHNARDMKSLAHASSRDNLVSPQRMAGPVRLSGDAMIINQFGKSNKGMGSPLKKPAHYR